MEVPAAVTNVLNSSPNNKFIILFVVALIVLFILKKLYDMRNSIDKNVINKGLIKGNTTLKVDNSKLPLIRGTYENTYSMWLYLNNNVQNTKATHIMHIGNPELTRAGPSIFLKPYKNDLSIKFSLLNKETRFTDGNLGKAPANEECKFPYRINWAKVGIAKPTGVSDNMLIRSCEQTKDSYSKFGYCPVKLGKNGLVENINDFGSCGPSSMDPNINKGLLNTHTCDIENIPLKRWFHLVITISNDVIEIFIDGRLVKTCVMSGLPFINEGDLTIFRDKDFDGVMGTIKAYPYTMSSSQVFDLYMGGPNEDNSLFGMLKKLFKISVTITFPDSKTAVDAVNSVAPGTITSNLK